MTDITYKCTVPYRDYQNCEFSNEKGESLESNTLGNPLEYKLFDGDTFVWDEHSQEINIVRSPTRMNSNIPGILLLENNRTFGRTANKKRLYYKCRPHDTKLPHFLIPYDMPMGFNKNFKNKYVTFTFDYWNDKHPYGLLSQNLGEVYDFPSYCEYILYCKQLHEPITNSINHTKEALKKKSIREYQTDILNAPHTYGHFSNREKQTVFSIDPEGCVDRDDALSIETLSHNEREIQYKVSVYIANVWVWLNVLDLWDTIGQRVSTMYFPIMKRPMLPTAVGEQLCSLDQDHRRFGFVMDFVICKELSSGEIRMETKPMPSLHQCFLKVSRNFDYEEPALRNYSPYKDLLELTKGLDATIQDSHDVVAYWMMQMNYYAAKRMKQKHIGIFRCVSSKCPNAQVPRDAPPFLKILEQQLSGSYATYHAKGEYAHEVLGFSEYIHFTSPIRRMVDLLNQINWVKTALKPKEWNVRITEFFDTQINQLDVLNQKMKKIRRMQADCDILYKITHQPEHLTTVYEAVVVSSDASSGKTSLYIEPLQWLTQTHTGDQSYAKYDTVKCQLFVFEKEEQMKKKIRVQLL